MMADEKDTTPEEETQPEEIKETPQKIEEEPPVRIPQTKEEKRRAFELRKGRLEELELENKLLKKNLGLDESNPLAETTPTIIEKLREEIDEKIEGVKAGQESERLLGRFLNEYPEYEKYEGKIRKFMNHPAYAQVPIGFIADGIAGKDIANEGSLKRKEADNEAAETETGGSTVRKPAGKLPDIWNLSKEEFEAYQTQIRQKGRE